MTASGTQVRQDESGLAPETQLRMYETVLLARMLDERMLQLNKIGKAPFVISCQGQEGAQVGAATALRAAHDWVLPYYRDLALCLHLGMTPRDLMLGLFAKPSDPNSAGRQMPAHYSSRRLNIVTGSSPVMTQALHATGVAYATKLRGEDAVTFTSFGEGSTSGGDFHEALNFASIQKLPVLFFCENNHYAISVPSDKQMAVPHVADRARAYGMPGVTVDGTDPLAVYQVVRDAAERARLGGGPTLIEALCQRFQPHSGDDDGGYRSPEEVREARSHDPVRLFGADLRERGILSDEQHDEIVARLRVTIDDATDFAEAAPDVDPTTLTWQVYAPAGRHAPPDAPSAN